MILQRSQNWTMSSQIDGYHSLESQKCELTTRFYVNCHTCSLSTYLAMDRSKSPRNCLSDVWYIILTRDISVIRKYKMLPLVATGRYSSRAVLILISVSAAICSFWLTSRAVDFVILSTLMRSSSSTSDPCKERNNQSFEINKLPLLYFKPHMFGITFLAPCLTKRISGKQRT